MISEKDDNSLKAHKTLFMIDSELLIDEVKMKFVPQSTNTFVRAVNREDFLDVHN